MIHTRHVEGDKAASTAEREGHRHLLTIPLPRCHSQSRSIQNHRPEYNVPDGYADPVEATNIPHEQNSRDGSIRLSRSQEQVRTEEQHAAQERRQRSFAVAARPEDEKLRPRKHSVSRLATQLCTISYLILFSILGTLARLGLQALTTYPGTPVNFISIWPNFAGSLVMGFLSEDRLLFREAAAPPEPVDEENNTNPSPSPKQQPSPPRNKKTIPLYIGLATGFCGSLTSFSAFIRDTFLALANDLPSSSIQTPPPPRNRGYSVLAVLAVPIITISLSLSALFLGGHLANSLSSVVGPYLSPPSLSNSSDTTNTPYRRRRRRRRRLRNFVDLAAGPLAVGCWLGAVLLSVFPPAGRSSWRGQATLALAFAPPACLARFYVGLWLNGRLAAFPQLGTFVVNVAGCAVLAAAWDAVHHQGGLLWSGRGGATVGCQVLTGGLQDGFCGCLTTVSTWVAEMAALGKKRRGGRRQAYVYGVASVVVGLAVVVAVAGGVRWGEGFERAGCG
ncbi:hypothetical protein VTK26DRAFT_7768 [Humicola hyalothermophila]